MSSNPDGNEFQAGDKKSPRLPLQPTHGKWPDWTAHSHVGNAPGVRRPVYGWGRGLEIFSACVRRSLLLACNALVYGWGRGLGIFSACVRRPLLLTCNARGQLAPRRSSFYFFGETINFCAIYL